MQAGLPSWPPARTVTLSLIHISVNAAKAFDDALDIDGVVLTKLDGDARGGAALSIKAVTGKPIKFAGVGEKLDQIEVFHPDRMASRILGMGDMLSLIEKAEQNFCLLYTSVLRAAASVLTTPTRRRTT